MKEPIRLLIVEDDRIECKAYQDYLCQVDEIEVIGQTDSAVQALSRVKSDLPDAMLLDLELGEGNGIDTLIEMKNLMLPFSPYVVVITNTTNQITLQMARDNGAGFICSKQKQNYSPREAVQMLLRAKKYLRRPKKMANEKAVSPKLFSVEYQIKQGLIQEIKLELSYISMTPKTKGYPMLIDAIMIALANSEENMMVTKDIYPELTKKYKTKVKNVERNIRSTIESTWKNAKPDELERHCPELFYAHEDRPTNNEFIRYYATKLKK